MPGSCVFKRYTDRSKSGWVYLHDEEYNLKARINSWKELLDLKKKGRVKYIGVSNWDLNKILEKIAPFTDSSIKEKINSYLLKSSFVNEELFKKYRSYFPSPFPEHSLLKTHPFPSSEWDYDKNYPLRPENFTFGSDNKPWWLCPKGHSYDAAIKNRTNKNAPTGCPYCSGRSSLNYDLFKQQK